MQNLKAFCSSGKTIDPFGRYQRQVMLPEVGLEGQKKLVNAKVFVVGAGGLASSAALYLAAAGVGKIGIADDDDVDITNLNRQILHDTGRIGSAKVDSARRALQRFNPETEVTTYPRRLQSSEEIAGITADYDLIIDCTDNFATRFLINAACQNVAKPWVFGAVNGFEGQVMTIAPGKGPCYRCLYPSAPANEETQVPVMGVTPGIIGIVQAAEAIKMILDLPKKLIGTMLFVDLLDMRFSKFTVRRNAECPACGICADIGIPEKMS